VSSNIVWVVFIDLLIPPCLLAASLAASSCFVEDTLAAFFDASFDAFIGFEHKIRFSQSSTIFPLGIKGIWVKAT